MPNDKGLLYYDGKCRKIFFAKAHGGSIPAQEFLEEIKNAAEWSKLDRVLTRLGDYGQIRNEEQFRSIGDDLYEVKEPGGKRLIGYFRAGHFIVTHGFKKRGGGKAANKVPPEERARAIRIREEFELEFQRIIKEPKK